MEFLALIRRSWISSCLQVGSVADTRSIFSLIFILCVCVCVHSVMSDSVIPWTVACQAPLSMRFPRQEYWSGLPFPSPGDLPDPEMVKYYHFRSLQLAS